MQLHRWRITPAFIVAIVALLFLGTYQSAYQLVQLEYGRAQGVTLWGPIAWIYYSLGFWPAVLVVPTFTLLVIAGLARKLRAVNEEQ